MSITFYQIYVILRNNEKNRPNFGFILPITRISGPLPSIRTVVCLSAEDNETNNAEQ